jgi:hypothetical protein
MPVCPQCLSLLPEDAPEGLCPACLLQRGLEANTVPGGTGQVDPKAELKERGRWTPPTLAELAPLFPDLDLLEFLGRGGMGAVYKARQKSLDRIVALKILPPAIGRDAAFAARFAQEAQAMARLNHPHIVTVYEFGQRGGQPAAPQGSLGESLETAPRTTGRGPLTAPLYFFLMEFVDGLNLRQLIDARTMAPKDALAIVPQICDALQYAHDRGIIHRDIKPENVLLTREGQIKIADFGLAKLVGSAGMGGAAAGGDTPPVFTGVAGTPAYMAPEQAQSPAAVDHRADIYALGVVFYQLLTGELPQGGNNLVPPSRKVQIDVRLDEIVLRALEKSPALRYQNATEFKTEVETVVSGTAARGAEVAPPAAAVGGSHLPVHGALVKDGEVRPRPGRTSRLAIAGALVSVVFLAALIVLLVGNWRWSRVVAEVSQGRGLHLDMDEWMWLRPMIYGVWAMAPVAFLGTTLAGIISVIRIRKSQGKLVGLPLALYDMLVFPLLGLDTVIWLVLFGIVQYIVAFQNVRANIGGGPQIIHVGMGVVWLGAVVLSAIADTAIVWIAWRIVRPAKKGPTDKSSPVPPSGNKGPKARFAIRPALPTAAAHVGLLALFVAFFVYVVPLQAVNFRQWHVALPVLTTWTIGFGRLVQQWVWFFALPALVAVAGLPFAAEYVGGRILRRVYSVFFTGVMVLFLLGAVLSLKLPANARTAVSGLDSGYLCEVVTDALLAEGYAVDRTELRYMGDKPAGIDLPGLCRLKGQKREDGTTPVAGSLAVTRFQPGVWEVTGRDALSAFHIIVHTPAEQGMGPAPALPTPPTQVSRVVAAVKEARAADVAKATVLLRQARTMIWLDLGDTKDGSEVRHLAQEIGVVLPEGVPSEEDLRALGSQRLGAGGLLQREVSVGEAVYFDYRLGGELAVVQVRVTPNARTNQLVCEYRKRTENLSEGANRPQASMTPRYVDGSWSVEFPEMDHWTISATRMAPGRFRIRVLPVSPVSKTVTWPTVERFIDARDADSQGLVFCNANGGKFVPPFPVKYTGSVWAGKTLPADGYSIIEITPELKAWAAAHQVDFVFHFGTELWDWQTLEAKVRDGGRDKPVPFETTTPAMAADRLAGPRRNWEDVAKNEDQDRAYVPHVATWFPYTAKPVEGAFLTRDGGLGLYRMKPDATKRGVYLDVKFPDGWLSGPRP